MSNKKSKSKNRRHSVSLEKRFWRKVEKTDYCWIWRGSKRSQGYGIISVNGKPTGAHRVAYELLVGPIPKGHIVRHYVCDNPCCVNPAHLKTGTRADNVRDRVLKGRGRNEKGLSTSTRFWNKIRRQADGCWIWVGVKNSGGYGRFTVNGKPTQAHRYSYEYHIGPIPEGLVVRHYVCNNTACVNPDHLKVGTKADNSNDMKRSGRVAKGEDLSNLKEEDILEIRQLYRNGQTPKQIAAQFGLKPGAIAPIMTGENWAHIAESDGGNIHNKHGSKEWRLNVGNAQKGKKFSDETKRKMSEAHKGITTWNKGIPMSAEAKQKLSESKTGVPTGPFSDEHRQAISNARKGIVFSDEHRANLSKARKGKKLSEETKAKMREAQIRRFKEKPMVFTKEHRAKIAEAQKGKKLSEAHKEALRKGCKDYYAKLRSQKEGT